MNFTKLPSVLSFKRSVVMTDAVMKNVFKDGTESNVNVIRHGIRGTQNVVQDLVKTTEAGVSQIQETDTAKTDVNAVSMKVNFEICFLPISSSIDACNDPDISKGFAQSVESFCGRSLNSNGMREVSLRFARNIANGRWLWRNRTIAKSIEVTATVGGKEYVFDALSLSLKSFSNYSNDEIALAKYIQAGLSGEPSTIFVSAEIKFLVLGAVEVYPSQNYISYSKGDKPKGFSRSLYKYDIQRQTSNTDSNVVGYAAIRDQKIGNAIRTIDTWYPDFKDHGLPISVEPNGANLDAQEFFRMNSESSFELFRKLNDIDPDTEQGMFCIASLIRGGVYSAGKPKKTEEEAIAEKAKKEADKAAKDAAEEAKAAARLAAKEKKEASSQQATLEV